MIRRLLDAGCDVEAANEEEATALQLAIAQGVGGEGRKREGGGDRRTARNPHFKAVSSFLIFFSDQNTDVADDGTPTRQTPRGCIFRRMPGSVWFLLPVWPFSPPLLPNATQPPKTGGTVTVRHNDPDGPFLYPPHAPGLGSPPLPPRVGTKTPSRCCSRAPGAGLVPSSPLGRQTASRLIHPWESVACPSPTEYPGTRAQLGCFFPTSRPRPTHNGVGRGGGGGMARVAPSPASPRGPSAAARRT